MSPDPGVSRPRQWLVRGHAAHWRSGTPVPWATVPEAGLPCPVLPCPLGRPAITIAAQGAVGSGPRAAWGRGDVRPLSPPDISGAASPRKPRPALRHHGPGLPCREGASCLGRPREVADPRGGGGQKLRVLPAAASRPRKPGSAAAAGVSARGHERPPGLRGLRLRVEFTECRVSGRPSKSWLVSDQQRPGRVSGLAEPRLWLGENAPTWQASRGRRGEPRVQRRHVAVRFGSWTFKRRRCRRGRRACGPVSRAARSQHSG